MSASRRMRGISSLAPEAGRKVKEEYHEEGSVCRVGRPRRYDRGGDG